MSIEPYPADVACAGPDAPAADQIDDLIRLLVTIRHRFGNTAVQYRVTWGGSALWAADELRKEIGRLRVALLRVLVEPHGCSLCDSGTPRNPDKGHQPDCPFESAWTMISEGEPPIEQVRAELAAMGVDTTKAVERVLEAVRAHAR